MEYICIKEIGDFNINDMVEIGFIFRESYSIKYDSYFVAIIKDGKLIVRAYRNIQIKEHFITLAEWREQQINSILEDY